MLTPANPDVEHAVLGAIIAPEEEAKLALNSQLARQFLEVLYGRYFSLATGTAFLEVRGKREGEGMTFRKFYQNPDALVNDIPRWNPDLNYWIGVALRRDNQGGTKEDLLALTACFGDVDCGVEGHKGITKYQTKTEALTAIEQFPLRPTMLIDSGGGFQTYWFFREPVELNNGNMAHLELFNKGLALALGGDVAATDASRILRLPGTYNQKLADNPRPVSIVWCEPDRVYSLEQLAKYEAKPQAQAQERRQAPQEVDGTGAGGEYKAYAHKALANELANLAGAPDGERNDRLNKSAFALGQLIAAGVLDRGTVEAALAGVAASIKLTGAEIRATIRSGIEDGMKQPRELPEKKARGTQGRGKDSKRSNSVLRRFLRQLDIQSTYERECSLKVADPRPNAEGWIPCYSLYRPGTQTPTAFINIGKGELRGYYREFDEHGQPWLSANLCKAISDTGSGPYMTPKDVYAYLSKTAGATGGSGATGTQKSPGTSHGRDTEASTATITGGKNLSDLGNARRLVSQHGHDLHFCHLSKKWWTWTGKLWTVDNSGEVRRRAKLTIATIYGEAGAADEDQRKKIVAHALRSEHDSRIKGMLSLAESEPGIPISPAQMDANPWLLNCSNGTVDLKTGELRPHDRADLITRMAPVEFDPLATCPLWEKFLDHIQKSNVDVISFIQRALGYSLTGDCREQCLFVLWGSGANGKSTLLGIISSILGNYAMQTPTETLLAKPKGEIPNDIARLNGPRFVTALEVSQGRRLAESLVKQLTGQDTISARFLFGEYFDFKPQFKLFLGTNHKPVIKDTSRAMWRRIRLIPFPVEITDEQQDKELPEKLQAEAPGILAWMVRGCLSWRHGGLGVPDEVVAATEDYQAEMDVVGNFISDCCIMAPGASATAKELYETYGDWAESNGEKRPLSQRAFGMSLTERGFERGRGTGGKAVWRGIGLRVND